MTGIRALLFPPAPSNRASLGLLIVRVVAGGAMMTHGWKKIQNPFHWMDKADSPAPAFFQMLAAASEFFGGLGLVVGALTVVSSLGLLSTMVVAINMHVGKGDPFGKYELAVLYAAISAALIFTGAGSYAVDRFLQRRAAAAGVPATRVG